MKIILKALLILVFALYIFSPMTIFAHQPRITDKEITKVTDPEISKAYYSTLSGKVQTYKIDETKPFNLYVNILVPDIEGQKKDLLVVIIKDGNEKTPLAVLDGTNFKWERFWEEFGRDWYWKGPEYKALASAGQYEIIVSSPSNNSKYSLAIGEIEAFSGKEGLNALTLIPKLKSDFFNESPIGFIFSPFGWGLILVMYLLAFFFGFTYRAILKKFAKTKNRKVHKNIGSPDRLVRFIIAALLLILATSTTWNPLLIFFSGFALFEALFSWCGFYATLGKKTCPISN